jgi:hypothetical protein
MTPKRKSWQEKLADSKGHPTVFKISAKQSKRWGAGTCVIPAPAEIDALMRRIPKGKLTTIDELRKALARRHRATIACPITTGIFSWIPHRQSDCEDRPHVQLTRHLNRPAVRFHDRLGNGEAEAGVSGCA